MKEKQEEIILKGRLNGSQRNRLAKLMNMMYSPSELADEVGFERRQVYRVYIPLGCPHDRDKHNRIWINGIDFRNWVMDLYRKKELSIKEAFCLTCKKPVKIYNPVEKMKNGLVFLVCACPLCGRKKSKIVSRVKK